MKKLTNVGKFRILYTFIYFADSIFTSFIALYLVHLGVDNYQKGIILAIIPVAAFLGNFFFGRFSTSYKRNLIIMKVLAFVEFVSCFFIGYITNFYLLAVVTFLYSFNNSSYFNIEDGTMAKTIKKYKTIYSNVRIFGSIGYLVGLLFASFIFDYINYTILFMISGGAFFFAFLFLFLFDKNDYYIEPLSENQSEASINNSEEKLGHNLFKNKNFYFYLGYILLSVGILQIGQTTYPLYLNALGLKDNEFALFQGLTVVIETVMLFSLKFICKKFKNYKVLLMIAVFCRIFTIITMALVTNIYLMAILVMISTGLCSAFHIYSLVYYIEEVFGEKSLTRVLLYSNGINSLFIALGNFLSPYLYMNTSYSVFYYVIFAIELVGMIFLLLIQTKKNQTVTNN
jgi:Arabinose efflux permease